MTIDVVLPDHMLQTLREASARALQQVPDSSFAPFHLANEICRAITPVLATQLTAIRGGDTTVTRSTPIPPPAPITDHNTSFPPLTSSTPPSTLPPHAPNKTHMPNTPYADALRRKTKPNQIPPSLRNATAVFLSHRHPTISITSLHTTINLLTKHLHVPFGIMELHTASQRTHGYVVVLEHAESEHLSALAPRLFSVYEFHENAASRLPASPPTGRFFYRTFGTFVPTKFDPNKNIISIQNQLLKAAAYELFVPRFHAGHHSPIPSPANPESQQTASTPEAVVPERPLQHPSARITKINLTTPNLTQNQLVPPQLSVNKTTKCVSTLMITPPPQHPPQMTSTTNKTLP